MMGHCMYDCEICGKKTKSLYIIDVEGAELTTCMNCAEGKNIVEIIEEESPKIGVRTTQKTEESSIEVIDNYGEVIRSAREKLGVPMKVLAEMINEKESMLNRIEHGKLLPNDKVVQKLEKNLGIKLTTSIEKGSHLQNKGNDAPVTLGDAAVKK